MFSAFESCGTGADKRSRNDSSHAQRIAQFPRKFAQRVQPLQSEGLFVCGNLENAIGGRVTNRFSSAYVFLTEFFDDDCTRGVLVPENPIQLPAFTQCFDEFLRKAGFSLRKVAPLEVHGTACDLPVSGL